MTIMNHNNPIAYKRWTKKDVDDELRLVSTYSWNADMSQSAIWKPKTTIRAYPCSVCLNDSYAHPQLDEFGRIIVNLPRQRWPQPGSCSCGIYGAWELSEFLEEDQLFPSAVYGRIRVGGVVIPAERGCRAEYATVDALYIVERKVDNIDPNKRAPKIQDMVVGTNYTTSWAWTAVVNPVGRVIAFDPLASHSFPYTYAYKGDIPKLAEIYDVPLITLHETAHGWEEKTEGEENDLRNPDR